MAFMMKYEHSWFSAEKKAEKWKLSSSSLESAERPACNLQGRRKEEKAEGRMDTALDSPQELSILPDETGRPSDSDSTRTGEEGGGCLGCLLPSTKDTWSEY